MNTLDLLKKVNDFRASNNKPLIDNRHLFSRVEKKISEREVTYIPHAQNHKLQKVYELSSDEFEVLYQAEIKRFSHYGGQERTALTTIEQLLGIKLERQYNVDGYRIDGYHKESNTAYEIDEDHHSSRKQEDAKRQSYIESKLGCRFVRIKV